MKIDIDPRWISFHTLNECWALYGLYLLANYWLNTEQPSRASAAALSTVLRTTMLSYRNIRFSGTSQIETFQPIVTKLCTMNYVSKIPDVPNIVGIGWLHGGGPLDGWNITSKAFLTILYLTLYLTLFILVSRSRQDGLTNLHALWLKRCGLLKGVDTKLHLGSKFPQNPKFGNRIPNCKSNQYTRVASER
jgi:hypothetical protein